MDAEFLRRREQEIQELYRFVAKQVTAGLFKSEILDKLIDLGVERYLALDLLEEMGRRLSNLRKRLVLVAMSAGEQSEAVRKDFWISGYEVIVCDETDAVFRQLERHVPDLVIADAFDPRMKGREVLAALRADIVGRGIPVFMVSEPQMGEEAFDRWDKVRVFIRPWTGDDLARSARELFLRTFEGDGNVK